MLAEQLRRQVQGHAVIVAVLFFSSPDARRAYTDALRDRLYAAGYLPHDVTAMFRHVFDNKSLTAYVSGRDDAERACDVASEVRGVMCKLIDDAEDRLPKRARSSR